MAIEKTNWILEKFTQCQSPEASTQGPNLKMPCCRFVAVKAAEGSRKKLCFCDRYRRENGRENGRETSNPSKWRRFRKRKRERRSEGGVSERER